MAMSFRNQNSSLLLGGGILRLRPFQILQTIAADLDLRDLYRNDILTCVQDVRAELDYEQRSDVVDEKELRSLVERLRNSMANWLLPISEEDRKAAFEIVRVG